MSLGGEKVFAHLSWKQSKKSAFGEIIFHSFPVFGLFKRGRKCVVGNWQEWPNASNCWWGNWNPCCRINVDNPIEFPSWQELAKHQLLWKYKKNTKIQLCQSQFRVCYLIQKFVSICWMIFWSSRMSSIANNCLKSVCRVLLIEMVLDLRGSDNFVFLLIFLNLGFCKVLPFSVIWKLFAKYYRGGIGPEGFGQFRLNEIELAPPAPAEAK